MTTAALKAAVEQARRDAAAMAQVLAELELISHGRTANAAFSSAHGSGLPAGSALLRVDEEPYPHELFRARWEAARDWRRRSAILAEARAHLEALRKPPPPPDALLERFTIHWYRHIANDRTTPPGELARLHGVSRQSIYDWRRRYGDDDDGT